MSAGDIISAVVLSYQLADASWRVFRGAINFPQDADGLLLKLELERIRFETWGSNAGLTDNTLHPGLLPFHELIQRLLERVKNTFQDADRLRSQYGLDTITHDRDQGKSERAKDIIANMRKSIHESGIKLRLTESELQTAAHGVEDGELPATQAGVLKRMRWSIKDKSRFDGVVSTLEGYNRKLNELLTETQQKSAREDWKRVNIVVVGSTHDEESLRMLRELTQAGHAGSEEFPLRALAEKKSIARADTSSLGRLQARPGRPKAPLMRRLVLSDFELPVGFEDRDRFLATARAGAGEGLYFMFEKKTFDGHVEGVLKQKLESRISRLVMLLGTAKTESFRTFDAIGSINDPGNYCWWFVFRFPVVHPIGTPISLHEAQPVCLRALYDSKFKPPLEGRLQLASKLAGTFSELYSSSWLHKGIRSDNIIFPSVCYGKIPLPEVFEEFGSPYVSGFNYSRQDTEAQTIDKGKQDFDHAIYRHPRYQGDAATGYVIQYDIYSFGLVLVEIARWVAISDFLKLHKPKAISASLANENYIF